MGDHRASIKIVIAFDGEPRGVDASTLDASITYCPGEDGLDPRVGEFFRKAWEKHLGRYDEMIFEAERRERERAERAELARLKAIYEGAVVPPA
jgi:hypothetical protein